jgi:hypothetical protein
VVAVIGFNPTKKYSVTPSERKLVLEKMLENTGATNIEVAGKVRQIGEKSGSAAFHVFHHVLLFCVVVL